MLQIKYRRTLQVQEYEPISIEVSRDYDDLSGDATKIFKDGVAELEKLVDTELEAHAEALRQDIAQQEFGDLIDVGGE